ncbi:GIY-YIG nuclease family protein [Candidatus Avelusimicrobium alvi]|uniref:GIY-YIG nuclease family protein n=1 Tax=Candidatus Avelusimicrobium alvi TaxID=3416221 RepID=UPI003D0C5FFD
MYCVYILTNKNHTVLYIGVTGHLIGRIYQHRQELAPGFTARYKVHKLVYYEIYRDALAAIAREKQLKTWNRAWKERLIAAQNPSWRDLYEDWGFIW